MILYSALLHVYLQNVPATENRWEMLKHRYGLASLSLKAPFMSCDASPSLRVAAAFFGPMMLQQTKVHFFTNKSTSGASSSDSLCFLLIVLWLSFVFFLYNFF